jgi:hypothetical protein
MQQCNICSSNPNNKTYNYQTFVPDEYVKPTRPSTGFIIEGLNTITQNTAVSGSATGLNNSHAKHIECSLANKILCDDLNKQYNDKFAIVAELEPAYTTAKTTYDLCNNHKNRCIGIDQVIKNTQRNINEYDVNINKKTKILKTCDPHKARCDKILQKIKDKEKQIADLKGYIATNEDLQKKNMCNA